MILAQDAAPLVDWEWVGRNADVIWQRTAEHLALTGVAVVVGMMIATVLALVALRRPKSYSTITAATGLLYTIPALAVFALVAPFVGIGTNAQRFVTAEVALISYTLLILIRNMVTGVKGIPAEVREAADGMGYRDWERVRRIEFPLALPAVIAGIRIATVTVIGLVTVTALIGLGGLGFFILDGLRRSIIFPTEIIVGVALSVALAALIDISLLGLGKVLTPWARTGGD